MLKFIRFLFTGSWHEHTFELITANHLVYNEDDTLPVAYAYTSRCTGCGKIERKIFRNK